MGDVEVTLYDYGSNKLKVCKFIQEFLNITLREAKAICDATEQGPQTFNMYGAEAKEFADTLQELGAKVEVHSQDTEISKISNTKEESSRIKDLESRIEALEARVAALEKARTSTADTKNSRASEPAPQNGITRTISKDYLEGGYGGCAVLCYFVRQSNGKMGYLKKITTSEGNCTVGQTRKIADMFGYKYDSKTKREMLGFELVSKYGDGEWAFIGKNAVDANGVTYNFIHTKLPYDPDYLKFATGQLKDWEGPYLDWFENDPLVVDPKWTPEEIAAKLIEFHNSLVRK